MAFVPLALAAHGAPPRKAFGLGLWCAFVGWLACAWWLVPGLAEAGRTPLVRVVALGLGLCLLYAIPYALSTLMLARTRWLASTRGALVAALAWTAIHWGVPHVLPGNLAHSQYQNPQALQALELGGVPLLLALMYAVNFLIARAVVASCSRQRRGPLRAAVAATLAAGLVTGLHGWGEARLEVVRARLAASAAPRLSVTMVHAALPTSGRDRAAAAQALRGLAAASGAGGATREGPALVIWPEIPAPISHAEHASDARAIASTATRLGAHLLVAGDGRSPHGRRQNVVEWIGPDGTLLGRYAKRRLMPFGEYLPGERWWPALRRAMPGALDYAPGRHGTVFELAPGIRVAPLICYEAAFADLARADALAGANLIVNPVNDAWFGAGRGPEVHLALTVMRAAELRVPIVRVANGGVSAVVDATGTIRPATRIGPGGWASVQTELAPGVHRTLYLRAGEWAGAAALAATLVALARWRRRLERATLARRGAG